MLVIKKKVWFVFSKKSLLVELKNLFFHIFLHLIAEILLEKENMSTTPYSSTYWTEHTQTARGPELWLV